MNAHNTIPPLQIKTWLCLLLATAFLPFATASVTGTWSGLDKTNFNGQLRDVTITLQPATAQQAAIYPRVSPFSLPVFEKQILYGKLHASVPNQRGRIPQESRDIISAYFPEINLLTLYFVHGNRVAAHKLQIGILDPDSRAIAFFHTGMAAQNTLPYYLVAGETPPQSLQKLTNSNQRVGFNAGTNPVNVMQAIQERKAAQKAQQQAILEQQKILQKYLPQLQALQQEVIAATQSGDYQRAQELRIQHQEMAQTIAAIQRGEIPAEDAGSLTTSSGTGCPENILAWVAQIENNGENHQEYPGAVRVANLFRDEYFVPHFEKPFNELSKQQSMKIARSFQSRCLVPSSPLYHSRIASSLSSFFTDGPQLHRFGAASAAQALDILARWQANTTQQIEANSTLPAAETFEIARAGIAQMLWPKEQESASQTMAAVLYNKISESFFSQLSSTLSRLSSSDTAALRDFDNLMRGELYQKVPKEHLSGFDQKIWEQADPVIESYLQNQLQAFANMGSPRDILVAGKRWYNETISASEHLKERPYHKNFINRFIRQRDQAYLQGSDTFANQIANLETASAAQQFTYPFLISLDNAASPNWRELKAIHEQRIKEINWQAHLARVGDGPFGPDHPGAIYLNAVYRGDITTLRNEDASYQDEILSFMSPLLNDPAIDAIGVLMTGGIAPDFKLSEFFIANVKDTHAYDTLLAYLVVNYYERYSTCNGRPTVVIPVTTTTSLVKQFSDGHTTRDVVNRETTLHTVLKAHSQAWRSFEGKYSSPERLRFINTLSKFLTPQAKELNYATELATTVEGLAKAMRDYPCDHDVIKTLEQNLLDLFNGRRPSWTGQVRTSWKSQ